MSSIAFIPSESPPLVINKICFIFLLKKGRNLEFFNPENINLDVQKDNAQMGSPMKFNLPHFPISGFLPIIIKVTPISNLNSFLGIKTKAHSSKDLSFIMPPDDNLGVVGFEESPSEILPSRRI